MTFDPTPHLRWVQRPVPHFDGRFGGPPRTRLEKVLQVGFRPINGGDILWQDVPVAPDEERKP